MHSNNDGMPMHWTPPEISDFERAVNKFYNESPKTPLTREAAQFGYDYRNTEVETLRARCAKLEAEDAKMVARLHLQSTRMAKLEAEVAVARERLGPAGYKLLQELGALRTENSSLREQLEGASTALEEANEYVFMPLPHLADISGWQHQVDHAIHFIKQTHAWIENAADALSTSPAPSIMETLPKDLAAKLIGDEPSKREELRDTVIEAARKRSFNPSCMSCESTNLRLRDALTDLDAEEGK